MSARTPPRTAPFRPSAKAVGICLAFLCLASIPLACALGPLGIPPAEAAAALLHALGLWSPPAAVTVALPGAGARELDSQTLQTIVCSLRFPRVLLSFVSGAGLAVAGAMFQAVLRNPLADPFTLGVSSGAAFGASLAISLGLTLSLWALPLAALCGAGLSLAAVLFLSRISGGLSRERLILAGIVVSAFLAALISLIKALDESSVTGIVFWIMGSFQGRGSRELGLVLPGVIFGVLLALALARQLDMLSLGDDTARLLGLGVARARLLLLLAAGAATASCVAVSGIIGFVGLVVPHLCRMLLGAAHRRLLPACALGGGLLLLWSDTLARMLLPGGVELPVGVITAMFGGPFFCYVLGRKGRATALPDAERTDAAPAAPPPPRHGGQGPLLVCEGLVFHYPLGHYPQGPPVLNGIDFSLDRGGFTALLGPNGSGKSTLLRCLSGLERPQRGRLRLAGSDPAALTDKERARLLACLPQRPEDMPLLPAFALVLMGRYAHTGFFGGYSEEDRGAAHAALAEVGALDLGPCPAPFLSGGELQRVLLARALAGRTPLLFLDEATAGLDVRYQSAVLEAIAGNRIATGLTVFAAMHDINLASLYADRLIFLKNGRILADGPPQEVFTPHILETVYDAPFIVLPHPGAGRPQALSQGPEHTGYPPMAANQ